MIAENFPILWIFRSRSFFRREVIIHLLICPPPNNAISCIHTKYYKLPICITVHRYVKHTQWRESEQRMNEFDRIQCCECVCAMALAIVLDCHLRKAKISIKRNDNVRWLYVHTVCILKIEADCEHRALGTKRPAP